MMVDWPEYFSELTGNFSDLETLSEALSVDEIKLADQQSLRLEDLRNLFKMIETYIQRRKDSVKSTRNKHIDELNDLKLKSGEEQRELNWNIEKLSEEKSKLQMLCKKYLYEISHLNHPSHTKRRLINESRDLLPSDFLEEMRALSQDSKIISQFSISPAFSGPLNQSLLPHPQTDGNLMLTSAKFGNAWQMWDKNHTTGDTSRIIHSDQSVSAVLCDGAGSTGIAGMLYSRVLATLIAEKIPMSVHSLAVLAGNPMRRVLLDSLRHKDGSSKRYSPLYRSISSQDAKSLPTTLKTGRSTALNVIIHSDGLFWYSSVGDCHLYIIRFEEDQSPLLIPIYTTTNESDNTDLIGMGHQSNITRSSEDGGKTCYLNEGDILVLVSDHIASYASKADKEFAICVDKICDVNANYPVSINNIESLMSQIIATSETSDDISALFFRFGEIKEKPLVKKIGWSQSGGYTYEGRNYKVFEKNYYHDGESSGIKRINKYVASNLFLILHRFDCLPEFVPSFQIYQSPSGTSHYIVIEHLMQEEFVRLDNVIYNIASVDEIEQVQNLLETLKQSMTDSGLVHCDIAPTNIFLSRAMDKIKVVDLDTLYCSGCFPFDIETGHKGMFGDEMKGYVPSMYIHKFPFLVLQFTLEIIKSYQEGIEVFVQNTIQRSAEEEYLLSPSFLDKVFKDNSGLSFQNFIDELQHRFPYMDGDIIEKFLLQARQDNVFTIG
jgi:hypothetical protein